MNNNFEKIANKVSVVTIIWNLILSIFKLIAGLIGHSNAMISDAIHSASDVFSTFIVMIGVKLASKESDKEHPYGHERMECVAAIVLAVILCITGVGIGYNGIKSLIKGTVTSEVGLIALVAAVLSIVIKECMFWYTRHYAKEINSSALMADAWHHRSDALSSIGSLIGIIGARLGYLRADSIASVVIALFIVKAAYDIFKDAVDKLVDKSCDEATEIKILESIEESDEIEKVDKLYTRVFGTRVYVDLEISVDGRMELEKAHQIAERIHDDIERKFPEVKHIMVHVNPL